MLLQKYLAVVLLSGCFLGCSQADTSTATPPLMKATPAPISPSASAGSTLRFHARSAFKITHVEQRHDTLLLVSESPAVSYPLGQLPTPKAFLARYPGFDLTFRDEDPDSTGAIRVYTATKGTNFVPLFKQEPDSKWLEIASGALTDSNFNLATGVHVGMSQRAFLNTFFTSPLPLSAQPISTLALVYAVDGEMQYCHVSQGIIDKIQLASVFTIQ
jgi:hypothetical protein